MKSLEWFLSGITRRPFVDLLDLLSLPPDRLREAVSLLAAFMIACELTRVALGTTLTRSAFAHVVRCLLTFAVQAIALAAVLVYAAHRHPEQAFTNLGIAVGMYSIWYLTGQLTSLARSDNEGADVGFMTVGALITFPVGLIAALLA
jgi:preprotein translocase subunit SecF